RDSKPAAIALRSGKPVGDGKASIIDGVGVMSINGPIVRRADMFDEISGMTSLQKIAEDYKALVDDEECKCILISFDSPGGEANGISEFAKMVYDTRGSKPVYAYIDGMAASAAYWIASAASEIITNDTALLGSIGVALLYTDTKKRDAANGIQRKEIISSQSPNKRLTPDSEKGRKAWQELADSMAQVFVDTVAKNRGVSSEDVIDNFGGGGLKVGQEAINAGMADRLGSFETLLDELIDKAKNSDTSSKPTYSIRHSSVPTLKSSDHPESSSVAVNTEKWNANRKGVKTMTKESKPSKWERLMAYLKNFDDVDQIASGEAAATEIVNAPSAESAEKDKKIAELTASANLANLRVVELEKENAQLKRKPVLSADTEKRFISEADRWAEDLIHAQKIFPAQDARGDRGDKKAENFADLGPVAQSYFFAAAADELMPLPEGKRVDVLKAAFESAPKHGLTDQSFDPKKHEKLSSADTSEEIDEERIAHLHSLTPGGSTIYARAQQQRNKAGLRSVPSNEKE